MHIEFSGIIFYWRGPAPFYFVAIPQEESERIQVISSLVTYGWGVIPIVACIGDTEWRTSLIPQNGLYLVPLKVSVRQAEELAEGDEVEIRLEIRL